MSEAATRAVDLEILEFDGVAEIQYRQAGLFSQFCPRDDNAV
jgi:hypothetical protein